MRYREHAASPALAPWLQCIWERITDSEAPVRVLPDGCIDVVWTQDSGTTLVGANTTAFLVGLPQGTRVVGARLRPGGAPALFGLDAEALRDARVPLEDVLGERGARLADAIETADDPVGAIQQTLERATGRAPHPDPLTTAAAIRLSEHRPTPIPALAADLGLSERQLRRRVTADVGYGPKRLARVYRLDRALNAVRAGEELAQAALTAGYADQAHFTHECRELAGVPPAALLAA